MSETLHVLALSGGLGEKSHNTALLHEAKRCAPAGMAIEIVGIRDIPLYDADLEAREFPAPVTALREKIRAADALLIATPEYNFSFSGVLKNALDWVSRPPDDMVTIRKPVAIVGAGGRLGSARARYPRREVCGCLGMLPVPRPEIFVLNAWERFDTDGRLTDQAVIRQLGELLTALDDWARLLKRTR